MYFIYRERYMYVYIYIYICIFIYIHMYIYICILLAQKKLPKWLRNICQIKKCVFNSFGK